MKHLDDLFDKIVNKLDQKPGDYLVRSSEGFDVIEVGGDDRDFPQYVEIEFNDKDSINEKDSVELELRRFLDGTKWNFQVKREWMKIHREIDPNDPRASYNTEDKEKIV